MAYECGGHRHITAEDIGFAPEFGFRIKLLGVARRTPQGIDQRVHPAMVKRARRSPMWMARPTAWWWMPGGGAVFLCGRGAGEPTASAVVADLVDIARGSSVRRSGVRRCLEGRKAAGARARRSACYLRFEVLDVPGVLAEIAGKLADADVSIESMIQRGRAPANPCRS